MKIEIFEKYKTITADEGMVLVEFNEETDNILDYSYARLMIAPLDLNLDNVREITEEENSRYEKLMEEAIEKLNK